MKLSEWNGDPNGRWLDAVAAAVVQGSVSSLGFDEIETYVTKTGSDNERREIVCVASDAALLEFNFGWNPGRPAQQPFREARLAVHPWYLVGVRLEAKEDHEHEGAMENREWSIVVQGGDGVVFTATARTLGVDRLAAFAGACVSRASGPLPVRSPA